MENPAVPLDLREFMNPDPVPEQSESIAAPAIFINDPACSPITIPDTGVPQALLEDLALKTLHMAGPFSLLVLARHMGLAYEVVYELFERLRSEHHCQVNGMTGNVPVISITQQGRARARDLLAFSHYTGIAPVSLAHYVAQVNKQSVRDVEVHPEDVQRAFAHLVLEDKTLQQFGTALNSGSSIFIFGPPGVGKTVMAETLSRVLAENDVWIPHAVEIDGQIITVYDPHVHKLAEAGEPESFDRRWVLCRRPAILVGGELTIEMLDLEFNPVSKFYVSPAQMKANNGVLIIDDFGRQRISPSDLLNRWVVPLDRRIDYLSLAGGRTIEIPFEMLVVFASNLDPLELGDAAFFRRIQTKIKLGAISDEQFLEIFRRVAVQNELEYDVRIVRGLIDYIRNALKQDLRACHPRDIVNQLCWAAKYESRKPRFEPQDAMRAIEAYFLPRS